MVSVAVDPAMLAAPGPYTGTITILSGAAAPQFINVSATIHVDQSNVVATITPGTVVQSGGQWNLQIRLLETGGAATHVTAMKFNGADYNGSISA